MSANSTLSANYAMTSSLSPRSVGQAVRERMIAEHCSHKEAADAITLEMVEAGAVPKALSELVGWALKEAGLRAISTGHRVTASPNGRRPARSLLAQQATDALVPIANTGEWKRLGDFTKRDVRVVYEHWGVLRKTYTHRERSWKAVHEEMEDGETLEQAYKRLKPDVVAFLGSGV